MSRSVFAVPLAAAMALASIAPADAALIRVDFVGTNASPTGGTATNNPWLTPVPSLTGYLVYDSAAAATSTTGTTATNYANAIQTISFSIGDTGTVFSGERSGAFGSVQVRDAAGFDTLSFNNMVLSAAQLDGEVPTLTNGTVTRTFNNAQLTMSFQGPNTVFGSQDLFGPFDPAVFSDRQQLSVFLSYTQQPGGTTTGAWPTVSFTYNLDPVGVTVIPVPTAGLLLLSAAGVLAGLRRRVTPT